MSFADKSPEDRTAAAQKLRDEGDPRPVSQIEAEMLAQDQTEAGEVNAGGGVQVHPSDRDGSASKQDGKDKDAKEAK